MDYYFDAFTADLDLATAKGKADAVRALGPLIAGIGDRVQRTHYLQQLARMVQVDERSLWQQIRQTAGAVDLQLAPKIVTRLAEATEEVKRAIGPNPDMWQSTSRIR